MSLVAPPSRAPLWPRGEICAGRRLADDPVTTYYDQPQLKKSHWGVRVALYIFIAGLSGGAQLIATAADLAGGAVAARCLKARDATSRWSQWY